MPSVPSRPPSRSQSGPRCPTWCSPASACVLLPPLLASPRAAHLRRSRASLRSVLRGQLDPLSTPNPNPDPRQEIEALLFQLPADTEAGAAPVTDVKAAVLPLTKARRLHAHRTHRPAAWPRYHWHRERGAGAAAVRQRCGSEVALCMVLCIVRSPPCAGAGQRDDGPRRHARRLHAHVHRPAPTRLHQAGAGVRARARARLGLGLGVGLGLGLGLDQHLPGLVEQGVRCNVEVYMRTPTPTPALILPQPQPQP